MKLKKIIAVMLCALMAFAGCAMAEVNGVKIGNLQVTMDGQTIDLSGIDLTASIAENENGAGIKLGVDVNGAEAAAAVVAFGAEKLLMTLTGLSDVYGVSYQDIMVLVEQMLAQEGLSIAMIEQMVNEYMNQMMAMMDPAVIEPIAMDILSVFQTAITDNGVVEIEGVQYQNLIVDIPEDKMDVVINGFAKLMDQFGADMLQGSGYNSYVDMIADAGVALAINGNIYFGMDGSQVFDIYVTLIDRNYGEEIEVELFITGEPTAEEGAYPGINYWLEIYTEDDDFTTPVADAVLSIEQSIDANYFSAVLVVDDMVYFAVEQDAEYIEISFGPYEGDGEFTVGAGYVAAGRYEVNVYFNEGYGTELFASYVMDLGEGGISVEFTDGYNSLAASADITMIDTGADWIPADNGTAVNLLTIDETQLQKVSNEAMTLAMGLLQQIASANPTIAALMGAA